MEESRRGMLKLMALFLGGLAGLASAGGTSSRSSAKADDTFTLQGRGWHVYSRGLAKGMLPTGGDRMLVFGDLHEGAGGGKVGDFFATYFSLHQPGLVGSLASLEQHTFNLGDGSIMGTGTTKPGIESEDEFAILGGTGRYAGARGTYIVRQSHQEFGGDGTAIITFRLMKEAVT